jgi:hypothetical protein
VPGSETRSRYKMYGNQSNNDVSTGTCMSETRSRHKAYGNGRAGHAWLLKPCPKRGHAIRRMETRSACGHASAWSCPKRGHAIRRMETHISSSYPIQTESPKRGHAIRRMETATVDRISLAISEKNEAHETYASAQDGTSCYEETVRRTQSCEAEGVDGKLTNHIAALAVLLSTPAKG